MKKLIHILFLSCLKATELIDKKIYFRLSFMEKLQLTMHKTMCSACRRYEKQGLLIEKGLSRQLEKEPFNIDLEKIKLEIKEELEEKGL